jgi:hypothetical protein
MAVQLRGVADAYVFGVAGMEHRLDVETPARPPGQAVDRAGRAWAACLLGQHLAAVRGCVAEQPLTAFQPREARLRWLHVTLFGHPARQLAETCTWAVDPQDVDTNTWRPALVSRT